MGWFKKAVDKIVDPFVPESVKKTADAMVPESFKKNDTLRAASLLVPFYGTAAYMAAELDYKNTGGDGGAAKEDLGIGTLTDEEAQTAARKRLARASKYFTSALGDLSPIASAAQKVFS